MLDNADTAAIVTWPIETGAELTWRKRPVGTMSEIYAVDDSSGSAMLSRALPLLAGLVLSVAAAHPQEPGAARRGSVYAEKNCTECHAIGRGEWFSPEPSAPAFQKFANTPGVTWIALTAWLQRSHETMPDPSFRQEIGRM